MNKQILENADREIALHIARDLKQYGKSMYGQYTILKTNDSNPIAVYDCDKDKTLLDTFNSIREAMSFLDIYSI